jgi:CheY-like chemotaxis protein
MATLTRLGFAPVAVSSGDDAVAALTAEPLRFSLVILDWDMPGLDGPNTLAELRKRGLPESVPILLSGLSSQIDTKGRELGAIGAAGLLVKPVTPAGALDAVLAAVCGESGRPSEMVPEIRPVVLAGPSMGCGSCWSTTICSIRRLLEPFSMKSRRDGCGGKRPGSPATPGGGQRSVRCHSDGLEHASHGWP